MIDILRLCKSPSSLALTTLVVVPVVAPLAAISLTALLSVLLIVVVCDNNDRLLFLGRKRL